jgi:hypothetical protein
VLTTIVALALFALAGLGQRLALWSKRVGLTFAAAVVLVFGLSGIKHYFVDYIPQYSYGSLNGELATEAGKYLSTLAPSYRAYFLGEPRMYYGFSTIPFLAPQIVGSDTPEQLTGLPPDYEAGRPAVFLSIPEREAELHAIQRALPGGEWKEVKRVLDATPLFIAYRLPPGGQP